LTKDQENDIFNLIGRLIQTLSSPKIAIDDRHTPKLYARFLAGLLSRHRRDGASVGRLQPVPPSQIPLSGGENSTGQSTSASASVPAPASMDGSLFTSSTSEKSGQNQDFNQTSLW
jgi:hypothetical protein